MSGSNKLHSVDFELPKTTAPVVEISEPSVERFVKAGERSRLRKRNAGRSTTVYLPHEAVAKLRSIAFEENRSVTDVVTAAVCAFLEKRTA